MPAKRSSASCAWNTLTHGDFHPRNFHTTNDHIPTLDSAEPHPTRQTPPGDHPSSEPKIRSRRARPNPPHSTSETMPLSSLTSDRAVDSLSYQEHLDANKASEPIRHADDPPSGLHDYREIRSATKRGKGRRVPRETLPLHEHATPPQLPKIAPPEPHATTLATIRHVTKRTNPQGERNFNPISFRDASEPSSPPRRPSVHYDESDARHGGVARH